MLVRIYLCVFFHLCMNTLYFRMDKKKTMKSFNTASTLTKKNTSTARFQANQNVSNSNFHSISGTDMNHSNYKINSVKCANIRSKSNLTAKDDCIITGLKSNILVDLNNYKF